MIRIRHLLALLPLLVAALVSLGSASSAVAYVDLAPTLAKVISDSQSITLVEVAKFDRDLHVVVLKPVKAIKGDAPKENVKHVVATSATAAIPRPIQQWAEPGARAVLFTSRNTSLVCVGLSWYQVHGGDGGVWTLGAPRPDLPLAYSGAVSRLADGVSEILAGRDAVLTTVTYGTDDVDTSFDLALNRMHLPGLVRLQRIRANLRMPQMVMAASGSPAYVIGQGEAGEEDLPGLVKQLASADAAARAEAAEDVGSLGKSSKSATPALTALLSDATPRVRFAAAAALLRIDASSPGCVDVLGKGLDSPDASSRRDAAQAIALAGESAAPLTAKLAALLKDTDEPTQVAALQAITTLGPAAAKSAGRAAVAAITPLLDNPALAIDAADALGRLGSAARPVPPSLARMVKSDQGDVRWAGVRAMSQIGGPESHPAVEFMIAQMPKCTEVEGYNMLIYLSLLGTDAKDAVNAVRTTPIRNPFLPQMTLWAISGDRNFPWQMRGGMGPGGGGGGMGPGGPGGFAGPAGGLGAGGDDGPNLTRWMWEAYFRELGERLAPMSRTLAQKLIDGTAGDVPVWGYRMLANAPADTVAILSPHLADADLAKRERAAVALGYMGSAAAASKPQLAAALEKSTNDREKKLLSWALKQVAA